MVGSAPLSEHTTRHLAITIFDTCQSIVSSKVLTIAVFSQTTDNILAYADDMVLLTPSWYAMQIFVEILASASDIGNNLERQNTK